MPIWRGIRSHVAPRRTKKDVARIEHLRLAINDDANSTPITRTLLLNLKAANRHVNRPLASRRELRDEDELAVFG